MGHRCNLLLVEQGRLEVHYSQWGALGLLADALAGPDAFIAMIRECTNDSQLVLDAIFGEGIALVDTDRRELLIYGGLAIRLMRPVRRAYMRLLEATWRGWRVEWCTRGIADAWARSGRDPGVAVRRPCEIPTADRLGRSSVGSFSWVTVGAENPRDYSFAPEPGELLLCGPALFDHCAAREPGTLPGEDHLGGGIFLDPVEHVVGWWSCGALVPPPGRLEAAWAGWEIRALDGLADQVRASGRDPAPYLLSEERTQQYMAEELFPAIQPDPVASIKRLEERVRASTGGAVVSPEALKHPRAQGSDTEH